jgi:hypothetical protein
LAESTLGALEGRQPFPEAGGNGVVPLLGREADCRISEIPGLVGCRSVFLSGAGRLVQKLGHPRAFRPQQRSSPLLVHDPSRGLPGRK